MVLYSTAYRHASKHLLMSTFAKWLMTSWSCTRHTGHQSYDDTCDHVATPKLCYGNTVGAKENSTEEAPFVVGAYGDATLPKPVLAYPNLRYDTAPALRLVPCRLLRAYYFFNQSRTPDGVPRPPPRNGVCGLRCPTRQCAPSVSSLAQAAFRHLC